MKRNESFDNYNDLAGVALYIVQVLLVRSSSGGPTLIVAEPLYALPVILVIVLPGGKSPNVLVPLGHNVVSIP